MSVAALKHRLAHWREWELNPVVVKELRQAVRSWAVTGMLMLFLVVLFGTSLIFLVSQSFGTSINPRLGGDIFQAFIAILTGASVAFIPLYVGVRLAAERQESNLDLLYTSTLTPGRIIRGKLFCGVYVTLLFFSACMPFMAFTNLLRGVDLPTIFLLLLFLFLAVCATIQVAIFLACLPLSKPFKILLALLGILGAFWMVAPLVFFSWELMRSGLGAMVGGRDFWTGFTTTLSIGFAVFVLLYLLSVALISPASANRALPLRIYLTLVWGLSGLLSLYWVWRETDARLVLPWTIVMGIALIVAVIVIISSHDELSLRVQRRIPRQPLKRAMAFLFYNGAAGGLIWAALLLTATLIGSLVLLANPPGWLPTLRTFAPEDFTTFWTMAVNTLLYTFAYALTALWLHRTFCGRRPPKLAGVFALLLPAALALVPNLVLFVFNRLSWKAIEGLQLGSMFNVYALRDDGDRMYHLVCAGFWLLVVMVLNAKWFSRQVKHFRPLDRGRANPPPAPPPLPS
ncbi:MAG: hypothetical protein KIS67_21040 [Verrucomicrobiae bacterium]|nr:hypothetical protein [Verrucomicrobiae bacterium]